MSTRSQASSTDQVLDPIALGWGYQSRNGTDTGGSCWDLPASKSDYASPHLEDKVIADHEWSSTYEEAAAELDVELEADAQFDVIEGDFGASYNNTRESVTDTQILTLRVFLRSIDINFEEPSSLNADFCYGTEQAPMSTAEFLQNCGDQYIAGKDYGGYIIFVAAKQDLSEERRRQITADLKVDYRIGAGNLAAYANELYKLEQEGFEFRAVSRGFTNHLSNLSLYSDPTSLVSPSQILNELANIRSQWSNDIGTVYPPNGDYGVAINQDIDSYVPHSDILDECTGQPADDGLQCYTSYMDQTQGYMHYYETLEHQIGVRLDNMSEWYWGATTADANANKAEHQTVRNLLNDCMTAIEQTAATCETIGYEHESTIQQMCTACHQGAPPFNCAPASSDPSVCQHNNNVARIRCTHRHIEDAAGALSEEVQPVADLPANQRISTHTSVSQYDGQLLLGQTDSRLCTLGGISGELASTSEYAKLQQDSGYWNLSVGSARTERYEILRADVWCTNLSFFFDNGDSSWTTHPDIMADTSGSVRFIDSHGDPISDQYATALNGVQGNFAGGAEYAVVDRPARELYTTSQQGTLTAWGTAFGLDEPARGTIDRGLSGKVTKVVTTVNEPSEKWIEKPLLRVGEGFCFLHHVSGLFEGTEEAARLSQKDGFWWVGVKGLCVDEEGLDLTSDGPCIDRKFVQAKATCYKYDQTN